MEPTDNRPGRPRPVRRLVLRAVLAAAVVLVGIGLLPGGSFRTEEVLRTERTPLGGVPLEELAGRSPALAGAATVVQEESVRRQRDSGPPGDTGLISSVADDTAPPTTPPGPAEASEGEPEDVVTVVSGGGEVSPPEEDEETTPEPPEERAEEALEDERLVDGELAAEEFTAIGVTFEEEPSGPVFVRVRDELGWSDWHELEAGTDEGPDPGTEGDGTISTAPIWTGQADAYVVSLPADAAGDGPEVMTVHRDTRTVRVDGVDEAGAAEFPLPGSPPARPRSSWGAAPPGGSINRASAIRYAVVHHTVNSNTYSSAQVPGILRSIQAYHLGLGWSDIGYNFLVDRFGTVWEGRAGSLTSAAVGAHVAGFNTGSVGIANIGTYSQSNPTAAQVNATAEIAAWRLAAYGVDTSRLLNVTAGNGADRYAPGTVLTIPPVVGHRDLGATSCPGNFLWSQLGAIRTITAARARNLSAPFGNLERWVSSPGKVRLSGWAVDPQTSGPVVVYVEAGPYRFSTLADRPRPDVGAAYPSLGPDHGFDATFSVPAGRYRMCVYAIDPQNGAGTVLRCGELITGGSPLGAITGTSVRGSTLTVEGWSIDPDTSAPTAVLVDAGGSLQAVLANRPRPELAFYFPWYGPDHGFVARFDLPPGARRVCAYGLNQGPGADAGIGCTSVVVK